MKGCKFILSVTVLVCFGILKAQDKKSFSKGFYIKAGLTNNFLNYSSEIKGTYETSHGRKIANFNTTSNNLNNIGFIVGLGTYIEKKDSKFSTQLGFNYSYSKVLFFKYNSMNEFNVIYPPTPPISYTRTINNTEGYIEESVFCTDLNFGLKLGQTRLFLGVNPTYCIPKIISTLERADYYAVTPEQKTSLGTVHGMNYTYYGDSIVSFLYSEEKSVSWPKPNLKESYLKFPIQIGAEYRLKVKSNNFTFGLKAIFIRRSSDFYDLGIAKQFHIGYIFN